MPNLHLPSFLPGSASLVEQLDRKIMIILRDGRQLVGVLKTFDQFNNIILCHTFERRYICVNLQNKSMSKNANINHITEIGRTYYYTDIPRGLYLVRGDSVVLLGEIEEHNVGSKENITKKDFAIRSRNLKSKELIKNISFFQDFNIKRISPEDFVSLEKKYSHSDVTGKKINPIPWEFETDL